MRMSRWWMVRAGDHNELIPVWKQQGIVMDRLATIR